MLLYEQNHNPVNSAKAAMGFISYAESIGAIKEDSVFLRESLGDMLSRSAENEAEKFNRLTVQVLTADSQQSEVHNG